MKGKRLVIVEWLDHSETTSWVDFRDVKRDPMHVFSVGWLIAETDEVLIIAPNYNVESGEVSQVVGAMQILKKVVVSVTDAGKSLAKKRKA